MSSDFPRQLNVCQKLDMAGLNTVLINALDRAGVQGAWRLKLDFEVPVVLDNGDKGKLPLITSHEIQCGRSGGKDWVSR